jgi:sortase A
MAAQRMLSHTARKRTLSLASQAAVMPAPVPPSAISLRQAERIPVPRSRVSSLPVAPPAQNNWQVPILWMFVIIPAILLFIVIGLFGFVALRDPQDIRAQAEASPQQLTPTVQDDSSAVVELIEPTPSPSATFIPISEVVGEPIATPPAIDLSTIPTPFVSPTVADDKENDKVESEEEQQEERQEERQEIRPEPWPYKPASGSPDRIRAPRVGIDASVIPVGSYLKEVNGKTIRFYNVAEYAAGWHDNSSLPGFRGNVVLAGHHNQAGKVFQNALDLELGDIMFLDINDDTYSYIVARKDIFPETTVSDALRNENGRWIAQTEDERLTLVTCYPPDGNSHRLIIVAVPIK